MAVTNRISNADMSGLADRVLAAEPRNGKNGVRAWRNGKQIVRKSVCKGIHKAAKGQNQGERWQEAC